MDLEPIAHNSTAGGLAVPLWITSPLARAAQTQWVAVTTASGPLPRHATERRVWDPNKPFTTQQAHAHGVSEGTLRGPRFTRLHHGIHVATERSTDPWVRACAALMAVGSGRVSHTTAARLLGIPVPASAVEHVTVTEHAARRRHSSITCHVQRSTTTSSHQGLPISDGRTLFAELAEQLELLDLVVAADAMLRRGVVTAAQLEECAAKVRRSVRPLAKRAAALARPRVDSPQETRLRLLFVLAGFPEPLVNPSMSLGPTGVTRRFDLCWDAVKVIAEYDGRHHMDRQGQWESDLARREQIDNDGWRILVFTSRDLNGQPEEVLRRTWQLLHERGLAGLPSEPEPRWRVHWR